MSVRQLVSFSGLCVFALQLGYADPLSVTLSLGRDVRSFSGNDSVTISQAIGGYTVMATVSLFATTFIATNMDIECVSGTGCFDGTLSLEWAYISYFPDAGKVTFDLAASGSATGDVSSAITHSDWFGNAHGTASWFIYPTVEPGQPLVPHSFAFGPETWSLYFPDGSPGIVDSFGYIKVFSMQSGGKMVLPDSLVWSAKPVDAVPEPPSVISLCLMLGFLAVLTIWAGRDAAELTVRRRTVNVESESSQRPTVA